MKKTSSAAPAAKAPAKAPKAKRPATTARKGRPPAQSKKPAKAPDSGKGEIILAMLRRPGGATSVDIGQAVGWLPNSIRGFFFNLKKKGSPVTSTKEKGKPTMYSLPAPKATKGGADPVLGDVI